MNFRIVEDWIEFEGVRIARLLPSFTLTLRDRLNSKLEEIDINEGVNDFMELLLERFDGLGEKMMQMIEELKEGSPRTKTLAQRMAKAKMRVISTEKGTA